MSTSENVAHRFIQVHQAYEQEDAWSLLQNKATSTMTISHVCEKLYNQVSANQLDLVTTLQNLQNLVLTTDDQEKIAVFVQALARLTVDYEKSSRSVEFAIVKQSIKSSTTYLVHPFIAILKQKPSLYFCLLDQVDYLFTWFDGEKVLSALSRFIEAVFLTENQVQVTALVSRLIMVVDSKSVEKLFHIMLDILHKYPLRKQDPQFLCLFDTLMWLNKTYSCTNFNYLYTLLDRLLTTVEDGQSIIPHLIRLDRLLTLSVYDFNVIWTGLSFALLKVQTIEEQQLIIDTMQNLPNKESANSIILRVAYLPLYQVLAELNDKQASKKIADMKKNTISMISFVDNEGTNESFKQEFTQEMTKYTYGMLGRLLSHLESINATSEASLADTTLTLLFTTPFVFSGDETACEAYSRIARLTSVIRPSYKFPALLFFLRGMHVSSGNALIITHLFNQVIPSLVDVNDPVITSKVLQVILTSISGQDSAMTSLGVKALGRTYELQPRVWQELKKVFAEWVLRRKSGTVRRKIDLTKTGPIKMELAVLTTMRDVCKTRPKECAPDVLPMVISLLQTCQDLSIASLSIMVDIINSCVEAGLVESRSIWNITVVYLAQFALEQGVEKSLLLTKQLCRFYAIAGARNDVSEPYLQFKESLLREFVSPLLESNHEDTISHALLALSKFPAQDITIILPEKAMDYVVQCTANKNQHKVLATLMSNELDHMRRGLFKEEATKQKVEVQHHEASNTNEAGEVVGQREIEMEAAFVNSWEEARVAPGLRAGYANAMLHILESESAQGATMEAISKTKWYRHMITLFTDVSLTDHLLIRVSSIKSWEVFFKNALKGSEADMEAIVQLVLKDLLSRLERSTVPGVTCNIFLAMTGLVSTVRLYIPSFATSCATDITEVLLKNYIAISSSPLSHSIHLMSEEVQFAARFTLGHLAAFVISNDKLVSTLYSVLLDSAISTSKKSRNIDTAVDLVQFANGYAAGHFVASLAMWPSITDSIEQMKMDGIAKLLGYCRDPLASDSRVLGIMMGLASLLRPNAMGEELLFAVKTLEQYLAGESVNKGVLLGSTWLAAAGALKEEGSINLEISGVVESAMTAASSDIDSAQHFYNFAVPYAQLQLQSYLFSEGKQGEDYYWNAFEPLLQSIENDDASSHYRIASLFSMGCLLGVSYIGNRGELIYIEAEKYLPAVRQRASDKLAYVSGLNSRSAPVGNLKSGRIAASICGKVIESAKSMMNALSSDPNGDGGENAAEKTALLSASSEPISYARLNSNTSYIRAVFDRLTSIATDIKQSEVISMLLKSFIDTPGPLPPVNWFSLITKISKLSSDILHLCLHFSATHAATSLSLSEFLLTQMTSLLATADPPHVIFKHVGMVLELSGLPSLDDAKDEKKRRGMNAVIKRISISESRALEILQLLGQNFPRFGYEAQYTTLSNLEKHLPATAVDESKSKFVSSIRDIILQNMTMYMFETEDVLNPWYEKVVRKAVVCSVTDVGQISPVKWDAVSNPVGRIVALVQFYQSHLSQKQIIVKRLSSALVYLIGMSSSPEVLRLWDVMAETIAQDKDDLGWIIRVLDAYVVYMGELKSDDGIISSSIINGLASILGAFGACSSTTCDTTKRLDLAYALSSLVIGAEQQKNEQEQIVRRLFKLYEMTQPLPVVSLFDGIVRSLPADAVAQNEARYRF